MKTFQEYIEKYQVDESIVSSDKSKIKLKDSQWGDLEIFIKNKKSMTVRINKEVYDITGDEYEAFKTLMKQL